MHIASIQCSNYRCFSDITIPFHPQLTVITGQYGKTATLDAIACTLGVLAEKLSIGHTSIRGYLSRKDVRRGGTTQSPIARIALTTDHPTLHYTVQYDSDEESPLSVQDRGTDEKSLSLTEYLSQLNHHLGGILPNVPFQEVPQPNSDLRFPLWYYHGKHPIELRSTGYWEVGSGGVFDDPYRWPGTALTGALDRNVTGAGDLKWLLKQASPLYHHQPMRTALQEALAGVMGPGYTGPHYKKDARQWTKEWVFETPTGEYVLEQLSQSEQHLIGIVLGLAYRYTLHTFFYDKEGTDSLHAPGLVLLDAVADLLYPTQQQTLLDNLGTTFPKTQFIITTQNPVVLTSVAQEHIRCISPDPDQATWHSVSPDYQTRGAELSDVLAWTGLMPPGEVREKDQLRAYEILIEQGKDQTVAGQRLYSDLLAHFGADHPAILDCHRLARWQSFKNDSTQQTAQVL